MQKSVFFVSNVHKTGIQVGSNFLYLSQVDISYRKLMVFLFYVILQQLSRAQQGYPKAILGNIYDKFFSQSFLGYVEKKQE